eukprot:scaffold5439_cov132-Cylindrotheca_fusiformis.AAC.9
MMVSQHSVNNDPEKGVGETESLHDDEGSTNSDYHTDGQHSSNGALTTGGNNVEHKSHSSNVRWSLVLPLISYWTLPAVKSFELRETIEIAENNADNMFGQLRTFATSITSNEIDSPNKFPNVSVAHFDLRSGEISNITGIEMLLYVPLIEQSDRAEFLAFASENQDWITQDYAVRGWDPSKLVGNFSSDIYECTTCEYEARGGYDKSDEFFSVVLDKLGYDSDNMSAPIEQYGPRPINADLAMLDLFSHPAFKKEIVSSLEYDLPVVSEVVDLSFLLDAIQPGLTASSDALRSFTLNQVKRSFDKDSKTAGYIVGVFPWESVFIDLLPPDVNGIYIVVESDCGSVFTYTANGGKRDISELGDRHEPKQVYEGMAVRSQFFSMDYSPGATTRCSFELIVYPSDEFLESYESDDAGLYAGLVAVVFIFTALLFFLHDKYSKKKQEQVAMQAKRAEAIVTSVFPKEVGLRLIQEAAKDEADKLSSKKMINNFLVEKTDAYDSGNRSKPIADLFPETTVMFADIVGFTAWSSMREPSQVFVLLESIYRDFDILAKKRKVFKVETVGDCYVAVCGLPEPRFDHAIVMSRFAAECVLKMADQVQALEVELGPDTADLGIRVGLHSGPVTAGVLRGDRARFQLFGDTVNTCARIESTGRRNKIHLSKETADILTGMGKGHWIIPRGDKVTAKGKGELETFWLKNIKGGEGRAAIDSSESDETHVQGDQMMDSEGEGRSSLQSTVERRIKASNDKKVERLINWNVDVLFSLLQQVAQQRHDAEIEPDPEDAIAELEEELSVPVSESGRTALDEVVEIIELPRFNASSRGTTMMVTLSNEVQEQLREYVRTVASMYNENSFHNFEHASHVTMSVRKLLGRIVAPDIDGDDAQELHDHTYGITSDPLTQFAVVLSALLHDVDHSGVSNAQLVKEGIDIAKLYNNKSVAEQNSIDLSWTLLMLDRFAVLRQAIYSTEDELRRFRQLVVNTVLATDIMDKELQTIRKVRWDKAFSEAANFRNDTVVETTNRKATIVIEHLIQASDIAHTMQHWQVYRKWNARLFFEMYKAYKSGRAAKDPSEFWYEGEIGFFDFYIIPLAKKLEECGVFGVSSHEYLNYAEQNRKEWEAKGRSVVKELAMEAESLTIDFHASAELSTSERTGRAV